MLSHASHQDSWGQKLELQTAQLFHPNVDLTKAKKGLETEERNENLDDW